MAEENVGGCPMRIRPPAEGGSNRDWWPDQINLKMLVKYPSENNPMDPDFDYDAPIPNTERFSVARALVEGEFYDRPQASR